MTLPGSIGFGGGKPPAYVIPYSVRFRSAGSTYLSRTPSVVGNRQKFTISAWVKRAALGANQEIFCAWDGSGATDSVLFDMRFYTDDALIVQGAATTWRKTSQVFRDVGAWYHVFCAVDTTTQTITLAVNGTTVSSFATNNAITSNLQTAVNAAYVHYWGRYGSLYLDGYLSDCYLIDGAALTPSSFGQTDSNGVWTPKAYVGPGNLPIYTMISQGTGTNIGDMTSDGGLTAGFDGVLYTSPGVSPTKRTSATAELGKNYGTGASRVQIGKAIIYSCSVNGFDGGGPGNNDITLTLYGYTTGGGWVSIGSLVAKHTVNQAYTIISSDTSTLFEQVKIQLSDAFSTYDKYCSEVQFYSPVSLTSNYGTNGVFLKFANSGNLGTDSSGNGNTYTSSGLAASDQMVDTPTNNYATLNPTNRKSTAATLSNGNLTFTAGGAAYGVTHMTVALPNTGKWAWKYTVVSNTSTIRMSVVSFLSGSDWPNDSGWISQIPAGVTAAVLEVDNASTGSGLYRVFSGGASTAVDTTVKLAAANDTFEWLVDQNAKTIIVKKNGTAMTTITSVPDTMLIPAVAAYGATINLDFGQNGYVPSDTSYKTLCTANLPAVALSYPKKYFDASTRTGTGTTQNITGKLFQPDMVWNVSRNAETMRLTDSVRGVTKSLVPDSTAAEATDATGVTAFNADGFTVGGGTSYGTSSGSYVDWYWKKGTTPGFDIVTYSGNLTNRTIAHALGATPAFIMVKRTNPSGSSWMVYHQASGNTKWLGLDQNATTVDATVWNSTSPTSSVFSIGTHINVNNTGATYVAYLWAEIPGFSKMGVYTGNGATDGTFVYCGFKPKWIWTRSIASASQGYYWDTARDTYNVVQEPKLTTGTGLGTVTPYLDITCNGFKFRNGSNPNGDQTVFMAFAEHPFGGSNVAPATAR